MEWAVEMETKNLSKILYYKCQIPYLSTESAYNTPDPVQACENPDAVDSRTLAQDAQTAAAVLYGLDNLHFQGNLVRPCGQSGAALCQIADGAVVHRSHCRIVCLQYLATQHIIQMGLKKQITSDKFKKFYWP